MNQIANNLFDPVTVRKVLKSLGLSLLSGAAVFVTSYAVNNDWKQSALFSLAAVLAPFAPNAAVEYKKGEPGDDKYSL